MNAVEAAEKVQYHYWYRIYANEGIEGWRDSASEGEDERSKRAVRYCVMVLGVLYLLLLLLTASEPASWCSLLPIFGLCSSSGAKLVGRCTSYTHQVLAGRCSWFGDLGVNVELASDALGCDFCIFLLLVRWCLPFLLLMVCYALVEKRCSFFRSILPIDPPSPYLLFLYLVCPAAAIKNLKFHLLPPIKILILSFKRFSYYKP